MDLKPLLINKFRYLRTTYSLKYWTRFAEAKRKSIRRYIFSLRKYKVSKVKLIKKYSSSKKLSIRRILLRTKRGNYLKQTDHDWVKKCAWYEDLKWKWRYKLSKKIKWLLRNRWTKNKKFKQNHWYKNKKDYKNKFHKKNNHNWKKTNNWKSKKWNKKNWNKNNKQKTHFQKNIKINQKKKNFNYGKVNNK